MKYINADILREKIEFSKSVYSNPKRVVHGIADAFSQDGRAAMCDDILAVMDAMEKDQQEQQDFPTTDEEVEKFLATHPKVEVPDKYKTPDWLFKKHEQQEVDLEKFTEKMDAWKARYNHPDNIPIKATMAFTARMFYMYPDVAREWYDSLPKATQD